MMPEVETHHHGHPTGRHWFDLVVPGCALVISVVSVVLAMIHGGAMERMADANARLVQASSWPFLQFNTSNEDAKGQPHIILGVNNSGVGPAKIESFELLWEGHPAHTSREFLTMCCGLKPGQIPSLADATGTAAQQLAVTREVAKSGLNSSDLSPGVMQAHEGQAFLALPLTEKNADVFHALNAARLKLQVRACYCSVFDECWISTLRTTHPTPVKTCPVVAVPYKG